MLLPQSLPTFAIAASAHFGTSLQWLFLETCVSSSLTFRKLKHCCSSIFKTRESKRLRTGIFNSLKATNSTKLPNQSYVFDPTIDMGLRCAHTNIKSLIQPTTFDFQPKLMHIRNSRQQSVRNVEQTPHMISPRSFSKKSPEPHASHEGEREEGNQSSLLNNHLFLIMKTKRFSEGVTVAAACLKVCRLS